jgi:hypothetical protein
MEVRRTRRGTTIRLTDGETSDLLTSFALSIAAYGVLQNFMTAGQKEMTLPSILFVSRLGAAVWDATGPAPEVAQAAEG